MGGSQVVPPKCKGVDIPHSATVGRYPTVESRYHVACKYDVYRVLGPSLLVVLGFSLDSERYGSSRPPHLAGTTPCPADGRLS